MMHCLGKIAMSGLPSHEGSGLKCCANKGYVILPFGLPSHEGSGLKYGLTKSCQAHVGLPSHEGSGLK